VILSGAFLAEAAATVDNKLNVQGGVLSKFTVGPERFARFVLVVLTAADAEDSDRRVTVDLRPPTTEAAAILNQFEVPGASLGEFPGFAFFPIETVLPVDGRWTIEVSAGGDLISLPLLVNSWEPPSLGI